MPVTFNIRHSEEKDLVLKDELPVVELDVERADELIHVSEPLEYDLEVERLEQGILVQGTLALTLHCECARCLKPYRHELLLENWACHLPLEGEEKVTIINDVVDLTPYIREDILLAFPQQPLCEPECKGLITPQDERKKAGRGGASEAPSTTWAE